jgi:hypothetical protein
MTNGSGSARPKNIPDPQHWSLNRCQKPKVVAYVTFGGLQCDSHSFAYVAPDSPIVFEGCLDSNPESCSSMQARYQLSKVQGG